MNILKTILLVLAFYASAAHSGEAGRGYLDSAIYSRSNHALTVSGWVASEKQNIFVTNIMIDVDGAQMGTSKNPIPSTDTAPANATITR